MVGITGVIWYPRGAAPNSAALIAGAGPVPLTAAAAGWSSVAVGLGDTAASVARVIADLRVGWSGSAADAALGKLAPFQEWASHASALAADTAGKAQVQSGSYTVAAVTMPSIPEIAAVESARLAAYTLGGALLGGAAAAELAAEALKIRAAATMETYDAATTQLAVQQNFDTPPSIAVSAAPPAAGALPSDPAQPADPVQQVITQASETLAGVMADPVGAATAAAASVVSNPVFAAAASQIGATAGAAAGAVSTATTAVAGAGGALTAVAGAGARAGAGLGGAATALFGAPTAPRHAAVGDVAGRTPARVAAASTSGGKTTYALAGGSIGGANSSSFNSSSGVGRHALPVPSVGQSAQPQSSATSQAQGPADALRIDPTRVASGPAPTGSGPQATEQEDDTEHDIPDYLKHFEHFADGRTVIPSVIGAVLETAER